MIAPSHIRARRGYSLAEMLIVVVLVGILMALVIPRMTSVRASWLLDGAAQQVQSDLRRTQSEAIRFSRGMNITRLTDSTYQIDSVGVRTLPFPVKFDLAVTTASGRILSYGPPQVGTLTFSVIYNKRRRTVTMNAVGRVSVTQELAQ